MIKFAFVIDTSPIMMLHSLPLPDKDKPPSPEKIIPPNHISFFHQSIFAIEEFIRIRKSMPKEFENEKYFLFKTIEEGAPSESCVLSSWEHNIKHTTHQLYYLKNTRDLIIDLKKTLLSVMGVLNCKRFLNGADNRI